MLGRRHDLARHGCAPDLDQQLVHDRSGHRSIRRRHCCGDGRRRRTIESVRTFRRPPGRFVDVGGFRLHVHSAGEGTPVVVFDAALAGSSISWTFVQPAVAQFARACAYDRAGFGWSDAGPMPRTAGRIADELKRMLERAGEPPPYLLVGHSFGGFVTRIFAARYRAETAALLLVDPAHPEDWVKPAPKEQVRIDRGVSLCRQGGVAARWGVAHLVSALVGMGALRPARAIVQLASERRFTGQRRSGLAACADVEASAAGSADPSLVLDAAEVLRRARQPDRVDSDQRRRDARGRRRRIRRPSANHDLVHESRAITGVVSRRPWPGSRRAAGT